MHRQKATRGFSLIELLAVIAIIGILASITIAIVSGAHTKSVDAQRVQDLRGIGQDLTIISLKGDDNNIDLGCNGAPGQNMLTQCSVDGAPLTRYKDPIAPNTPCKGHNYGPASTGPCEYTIGSGWGGLSAYGVDASAAEADDYEVCTYLQTKQGVYGPGLISITSTTSGAIVNGCF